MQLAAYVAKLGRGEEPMESWERGMLSEGMTCRRFKASCGGELPPAVAPDQLSDALVPSAGEGPMAGHLGTLEYIM